MQSLSPSADHRHVVGDGDGRQTAAAGKHAAADRGQVVAVAEDHACQMGAVFKRIVADRGHGSGDGDARQTRASGKSKGADRGHAAANGNARHVAAAVERSVADLGHVVRDIDGGDAAAGLVPRRVAGIVARHRAGARNGQGVAAYGPVAAARLAEREGARGERPRRDGHQQKQECQEKR